MYHHWLYVFLSPFILQKHTLWPAFYVGKRKITKFTKGYCIMQHVTLCSVKYDSKCNTRTWKCMRWWSLMGIKKRALAYILRYKTTNPRTWKKVHVSTHSHKTRIETYVACRKHERKPHCCTKTRAGARFSKTSVVKYVLKRWRAAPRWKTLSLMGLLENPHPW